MQAENAILIEFFRHTLWANAVMLDACRDLSDAQLGTELAGTYGRLDQTLVHRASAQGGYLRSLADRQPRSEHRLGAEDAFPGVDRLSAQVGFTGDRLIEVAWSASPDRTLEGTWNGGPYRFPEWVLLLHAAHHATGHRHQIAPMLTNLGIEPPEPDPMAYWNSTQSGSAPGITTGE